MKEAVELTTKQAKAIPVILAAKTYEDGCKDAKVSKSTFYAWMQDEAFKVEFERQRKELTDLAFETLCQNVGQAVSVLVCLLEDEDKRVRRLSAKDVLSYVCQFREQNDILRRLEAIEQQLERRT